MRQRAALPDDVLFAGQFNKARVERHVRLVRKVKVMLLQRSTLRRRPLLGNRRQRRFERWQTTQPLHVCGGKHLAVHSNVLHRAALKTRSVPALPNDELRLRTNRSLGKVVLFHLQLLLLAVDVNLDARPFSRSVVSHKHMLPHARPHHRSSCHLQRLLRPRVDNVHRKSLVRLKQIVPAQLRFSVHPRKNPATHPRFRLHKCPVTKWLRTVKIRHIPKRNPSCLPENRRRPVLSSRTPLQISLTFQKHRFNSCPVKTLEIVPSALVQRRIDHQFV